MRNGLHSEPQGGAEGIGPVPGGAATLSREVTGARLARSCGRSSIPGRLLRLRDVVERTGFSKGMCFRLLYTLHHCGFLEKVEGNRYRLAREIRRRKRYRIGYAAQGQDSSFAREVHGGLRQRGRAGADRADRRRQPLPAESRAAERGAC